MAASPQSYPGVPSDLGAIYDFVSDQQKKAHDTTWGTIRDVAGGMAIGALAYTAAKNALRAKQVGGTSKVTMKGRY